MASSVAPAQNRIVGGVATAPGAYPWMAALVDAFTGNAQSGQFCGGSLIAPNWVLTAAHCVAERSPSSIDVVLNRVDLNRGDGERVAVINIIGHPDYFNRPDGSDLALLQLARSTDIAPVNLVIADAGFERNGLLATTMGWGLLSFNGTPATELRQVDVPIVSHSACDRAFGGINRNTMICAGLPQGGKDACNGDSGGPLFVPDNQLGGQRLIGVVSFGEECALPGIPGVYARVSHRLNWIERQLQGTASGDETSDLLARNVRLDSACFATDCAFDGRRSGNGGQSIVDFAWEFGDGSIGSGPTVRHTYPSAGTYTAALTTTLSDGTQQSTTTTINVDNLRKNDFDRRTTQYNKAFVNGEPSVITLPKARANIGLWLYPGNIDVRLRSNTGTDDDANFDLGIEQYDEASGTWQQVTRADSNNANERIETKVTSGYYRFVVTRVQGTGPWSLSVNARRRLR